MTAYHWCGSYSLPAATITGSVRREVCLVAVLRPSRAGPTKSAHTCTYESGLCRLWWTPLISLSPSCADGAMSISAVNLANVPCWPWLLVISACIMPRIGGVFANTGGAGGVLHRRRRSGRQRPPQQCADAARARQAGEACIALRQHRGVLAGSQLLDQAGLQQLVLSAQGTRYNKDPTG